MNQANAVTVVGKEGLRGTIAVPPSGSATDTQHVMVRLDTGQQVVIPLELLVTQEDGSYYLPMSLAEIEQYGELEQRGESETLVIPVIEEQLKIQKRRVESGRVQIRKVVQEREETVNVPLLREEVSVERVPVNRYIDEPLAVRYEGETMIVPVVEEVLVVEKRLVLKEELHISKRTVQTEVPQTVVLRSEEAFVERLEGNDAVQ